MKTLAGLDLVTALGPTAGIPKIPVGRTPNAEG